MNYFKSIILHDPDPPKPENAQESGSNSPMKQSHEDRSANDVAQDGNAGGWSFGGLIKTLATRSESVIETYSKDLKEFGSGLRKESEIIREAASRAVKDLPASLEAGTSAAHGVLDGVLKSTAEIISKEAQVFASDGESETAEANRSLNSGRYSWFDAQVSGIQSDLNTFCEEPDDMDEYKKWKSSFKLDDKTNEIEELIGENGSLEGVYRKVVPNVVDHDTFWCRYFYRVDKLKQQEKVRLNLVKRAISVGEDDDDYSWDVDDDDDDEKDGNASEVKSGEKAEMGDGVEDKEAKNGSLNHVEVGESLKGNKPNVDDDGVKNKAVESSEKSGDDDVSLDEREVERDEVAGGTSEEKMKPEESVDEKKNENVGAEKVESSEKGNVSEISDHQGKMEEEDDLGWDEIEDIGSSDEKKISTATHSGRPNRDELRKQLNVAEDDEDFSWDIEDDDEPVKS